MPKSAIRAAIEEAVARVAPNERLSPTLERPRQAAHGDYASNVALLLAKTLGRGPMAVAAAIAEAMPASAAIAAVTVAPPGYLNFRLSDEALAAAVSALTETGEPPAPFPDPTALAAEPGLLALRRRVHVEALESMLKFQPGRVEDHLGAVGRVTLTRDGRPEVSLTPSALIAEIGPAATRFYCLTRPLEKPLEVDVAQAAREIADNPHFSMVHAHARLSGIMRTAASEGLGSRPLSLTPDDVVGLATTEERALLLHLAGSPDAFAEAAVLGAPHRMIRHGLAVADAFHQFYTAHRVLGEDVALGERRLVLVAAARQVLRDVLERVVRIPAPDRL